MAILENNLFSFVVFLLSTFVVLFSVILSILKTSNLLNISCYFMKPIFNFFRIPQTFYSGFISGIIELTNGLNIICNIPEKNISINIIYWILLLN